MALVVADRVQETTITTGTGTVTLAGAVAGYQSFAAIGNGNTTYYTLTSGSNWEVGIGTYTSSGTTLARTTVLASSAGGTTKITLSGTSNVFVTYPAEIATMLTNPTPTNGGVVYGTGTAIGVSTAGTASGYQFLQSAGAASPTWVQIPSFKDVAVAPSSPAPIEGDRFFDNTTGINYTYITDTDGSQWVETSTIGGSGNVYTKTTFTATASQTTFTLNYNVGYVDVYLNGVKLTTSDYTATTGTTVVLSVAAALNDIVEIIAWTTWSATNTAIGAGTGTSLALNGATLGSNALAVTGTTQLNNALNYGGVTLSNAVTGTGNMVLSAAPTLTGNLTVGTVVAGAWNGTAIGSVYGGKPSNRYTNFTNTTGFTPGTGSTVMGGFGSTWVLTPATTGKVRISVYANASTVWNMRYGTGAAPSTGAAATGTAVPANEINPGAQSFGGCPVEVTLSVSTAYWFDISARGVSGSVTPLSITIEEF